MSEITSPDEAPDCGNVFVTGGRSTGRENGKAVGGACDLWDERSTGGRIPTA